MTAGVFLTDLFTTALSSSKDVYKDAKLEFLNKSGVEAERFRRFNEFKAEYEHELDLMFKVYFNAKLGRLCRSIGLAFARWFIAAHSQPYHPCRAQSIPTVMVHLSIIWTHWRSYSCISATMR
jgi:hypothetical protein